MIFLSCEKTIPSKKRQIYICFNWQQQKAFTIVQIHTGTDPHDINIICFDKIFAAWIVYLLNLPNELDSMGCLLTFKRIFLFWLYIYLHHVYHVYGILHDKKPANTQLLIYLQQYFFGLVIRWSFSVCVHTCVVKEIT